MTSIAELFINLGIKGSDKTLGAIGKTKDGLKETASASLEAKAAIVGAMYALERLFATSGKAGTDLTNFTSILGVSAKTLQQYQYAARQVGVSNQEVEGSFKALQSTMTKTLMGEGAPKGLARVAQLTGGMTAKDIEAFAKQPQLLIEKLQQYAARESNVGLRNEVLKSFGLSDGMIAAVSRQAFKPSIMNKAPAYGDKEIQSLDKANIAWSNLGTKIEMAFGHFNAKHGGELVGDISKVTDGVLKLVESFTALAEKAEIFKWIGKSIEGWTVIFDGLVKAIDFIKETDFSDKDEKEPPKPGSDAEEERFITMGIAYRDTDTKKEHDSKTEQQSLYRKSIQEQQALKTTLNSAGDSFMSMIGKMFFDVAPPAEKSTRQPGGGQNPIKSPNMKSSALRDKAPIRPLASVAAPTAPAIAPKPGNNTQEINVTQNLNFQHEGKDATRTGDSVKRATQDAFRTNYAQAQRN